ncbi:translation initiation factor SUI1 [Haematococcus lacustris]
MADVEEATPLTVTAQPRVVVYDPVTGVPSEFNQFLPPECLEYKKWKASLEGPEALEKLTLRDKEGNEIEKQLPGGKVKKKQKPQVLIETNTRNKKKMVTTVSGLELFGVKLADASKIFGKKFACGCSVVKSATGTEQIDMQGDFLHPLAELLVKTYGKSNAMTKETIYYMDEKKKRKFFDEGSDDDDDDDEVAGGPPGL